VARDDWRIRVHLPPEERRGFLARLGPELSSGARELAKDLEGRRLAVSYDEDGDELFVYAGSRAEAEQARAVIEAELEHAGVEARLSEPEQWLAPEARWSDEPPPQDELEEEALEHGYAPWEVRVECESREEADALADRLEAEGYGVVRRAHYVLAGTATEDEARELAARLHGEVEAGGELVYEVVPQNPFAIFGGLGGTGTPI
jgi:hypothetical protein